MSIITEALKKVQYDRTNPQNEELRIETTKDILTSPVKITVEKAKENKKPILLIISAGLSLLLALSLGLLYFLPTLEAPGTIDTNFDAQSAKTKAPNPSAVSTRATYRPSTDIDLPVLNGIMYSPVSPQAVINSIIASEGEVISGFTVKRILPDMVILSRDGKEYDLKLK